MKASAPVHVLCSPPPTLRVLDRLKKTPLGAPENRLRIGCFNIAFHDNVLLIENGSITHLSDVEPKSIRVLLGEAHIIIDMWIHSSSTVTMIASPAEIEAAQSYFERYGITVGLE